MENNQEAQKVTKYSDLISRDQKSVDEEQKQIYIEESIMNIDGDMLSTKKEIAVVRRELENEKSKKPLNPQQVITVAQRLKALENGLAALLALKEELF